MNLNHEIEKNTKKRNWSLRTRIKETENSIRQISAIRDDVESGKKDLGWLKDQLKEQVHNAMWNVYVPSQGGDAEFNLQMQKTLEDLMDDIIDTAYRIGFKKS